MYFKAIIQSENDPLVKKLICKLEEQLLTDGWDEVVIIEPLAIRKERYERNRRFGSRP
jgi:hypothetical protein